MICISLLGCMNPSVRTVNEKFFSEKHPTRLMVVRFEGKTDFVDDSTDYFISVLQPNKKIEVIRGQPVRVESPDITGAGNIAPLELGLREARGKGVDLLIMGKVTSHATSGMLNGFSTVRIYDVSTGDEVANFHRPSGKLFGYSEHQCVMAAVKRTAKDTLAILAR